VGVYLEQMKREHKQPKQEARREKGGKMVHFINFPNEEIKSEAKSEIDFLWVQYMKIKDPEKRKAILDLINEQSEVFYNC